MERFTRSTFQLRSENSKGRAKLQRVLFEITFHNVLSVQENNGVPARIDSNTEKKSLEIYFEINLYSPHQNRITLAL